MIASEFAQRLGVPVSKIRYYDRLGLGQTERCEENNYRNFEPDDALEYGNALMLRSFDMNLKEISQTQSGQSVNEMGIWLEEHVRELEEHLRLEQIRLARLREMQRYWRTLGCGTGKATFTDQLANYEIWSFDLSRELTREEILGAQELTRRLPYSYIAAKIPAESLAHDDVFHPILGVGILERNCSACSYTPPACAVHYGSGNMLTCMFEKESFKAMTREELEPMYALARQKHIEPYGDMIGRFVYSHTLNGKRLHGLWMGIAYRNL